MKATTTTLPSTLKLKIDLTDEQFFQSDRKMPVIFRLFLQPKLAIAFHCTCGKVC
ncbi:hypothetical protein [Nostoc sp.]|uniref:hypothetical protein n=1 Tax=Nostoc sp. TaxID=1180 RepID=UPI002FF24D25